MYYPISKLHTAASLSLQVGLYPIFGINPCAQLAQAFCPHYPPIIYCLFCVLQHLPLFYLSYLVLLVTLVYNNDIAGLMSGLPLFNTHSSFETIDCRISASLFSSLV